jgi:hypothetical protein
VALISKPTRRDVTWTFVPHDEVHGVAVARRQAHLALR